MSLLDWIRRLFYVEPEPTPVPPPVTPSNDAAALLKLHNEHRAAYGHQPLALDEQLCDAAIMQAEYMHGSGRVTHSNPAGPTNERIREHYTGRMMGWAENVAGGQTSAGEVTRSWIASPGHNTNILGAYDLVGFGRSGNYWAACFVRSK